MEEWRDIKGYKGCYQVSNLGNVRSLDRFVGHHCGGLRFIKGKNLKPAITNKGYLHLCLRSGCNSVSTSIHKLVAIAFLSHNPSISMLVVNHIDFNKQNNNINNLEIVTQRENANKKHLKSTSKYTGVHKYKTRDKWRAAITINGKVKHLGYYKNEDIANISYKLALSKVK